MEKLTAADIITIAKVLARLEWRELSNQDSEAFADAGPNARIADVQAGPALDLAEVFDLRINSQDFTPMLAIIGGDDCGQQIEVHGWDQDGDPIALQINLTAYLN